MRDESTGVTGPDYKEPLEGKKDKCFTGHEWTPLFDPSALQCLQPCYPRGISLLAPKFWEGAGRQWLTTVILATQEAEMRRIVVQSQPGQIVHTTLSRKKPITKKGLVE
jgi:hypothetical protein